MAKDQISIFRALITVLPKINNPFILSAFALLIFAMLLTYVPGIPDDSKPWLLAALVVPSIILVAVFAVKQPGVQLEESGHAREFVGLKALIDSSNLPMYLTDTNLVMISCNARLAELLNCERSALEGQHLLTTLEYFGKRVPGSRRREFLRKQRDLIGKAMSDLAPHAEYTEYIDNRDLHGTTYNDLFRIHIHADKVIGLETKYEIGTFVSYTVTKVDQVPGEDRRRSTERVATDAKGTST
jgi:PAS domain-containing protein